MVINNIHEKIISLTVQLIAPTVFYFGSKENPWNLSTNDLLSFPEGTLGKELGNFYNKERLDPIPRAEYHDVFHVLFGFSTSLRDEVALQFFLYGNGKISIASIGTSMSSWFVFPRQWNYFEDSYLRGLKCVDVSGLDLKKLLHEDLAKLKESIFIKQPVFNY
jgi:ubiquinone biosynthesis protein Coq4